MFAAIEFEKKECAVVPLCWVIEDQTMCYWPKQTGLQVFTKMVKTMMQPKKSWNKFKIVEILNIFNTFEEATLFLTNKIEESSSASSANTLVHELQLRKIEESSSDSELDTTIKNDISKINKKRKRDHDITKVAPLNEQTKILQNFVINELSDSSYSDDEEQLPLLISREGLILTDSPSTSTGTTSFSSTLTSPVNVVGQSSLPENQTELYLKEILKIVSHIKEVQDQNTIRLDNIERIERLNSIVEIKKPDNLPDLPISNKKSFKELEEFLENDDNKQYMTRRLAAIGGSNIRNTTMNILKFLLTNQVAMKYNWSGRDKRSFKNTNMMKVINDAVKMSYNGRDQLGVSEFNIANAIKDWLKLAKHRFIYKSHKTLPN
ncbi:unnamed protein product [Brassicogethes aeneus]|uniref:DUF4806 domain-containing protein n=1 Tax=Brassicogethes aeneus TaxID=1431903 RepID=A0A9P0AWR1_BRAAE|nr:unnamed protein product [Brassicogethes aeneus]